MVALVLSLCGFVAACLALCRAVSDHLAMQQEVARFEQELKRTQKLLSQQGVLAHEIAHELKNPITAILCSVDTLDLIAGDQLQPNQRRSLRAIKEFGENVLRLLSDFLDVSRAESGLLSAVPEEVDAHQVAQSVQALLQAFAVKARVEVVIAPPKRATLVLMDPRHIKQVLFNVVHNAIKFSPSGASVTISFHETPQGVEIAVTDEGIGMSADIVEHAFDPYYSPPREKGKRTSDGLGLGLPLCRSLVALAGGSISLKSELGQGTTVSLLLPGVEKSVRSDEIISDSEVPLVQTTHSRPLEGQRVLILDEDPRVRRAVSELIEAWGGLAEGVSDAAHAVQALGSVTYDAVMLDEKSQNTSDAALDSAIAQLRAIGKTVIVSCRSSSSEAVDPGSRYPVLAKPYNGTALLSLLLRAGEDQEFPH